MECLSKNNNFVNRFITIGESKVLVRKTKCDKIHQSYKLWEVESVATQFSKLLIVMKFTDNKHVVLKTRSNGEMRRWAMAIKSAVEHVMKEMNDSNTENDNPDLLLDVARDVTDDGMRIVMEGMIMMMMILNHG